MASLLASGFLPGTLRADRRQALDSWKVGRSVGVIRPDEVLKLEETRKAGFECIEMSVSPNTGKNTSMDDLFQWCEQFQKKTEAQSLEVRSVHIPYGTKWDVSDLKSEVREGAIKECTRYFDLKNILGAKIFVLHGSWEPVKNEEREQRVRNCIESLRILAPIARDKGVRIALENLPRTCIGNTSKEMIRIVDSVDVPEGLRICFDSNHTLQEKPEDFVAACGSRIITTHMSDFDGKDEKHWLPYEGIINWTAVMTELVKAGYPGPFVFETGRFKDRPASMEEIFDNWLRVKENYEKAS